MPNLTAEDTHRDDELLGVWEEGWHVRALHVQKIERYRAWLRHHGASRDEAAVRTVRLLGAGSQWRYPG